MKMEKPLKFIRHRKIGKYELYIYRDYMSGLYVLQEQEGNKRSHYISDSRNLEWLLPTYNRCVREATFYN